MTNTNRAEDLLVAERAADWLNRMQNVEPQERAALLRWLKESRGHVRELLLATAWDSVLGQIDPNHEISIDELMANAATNAVPVTPSNCNR